MKFKLLPMAAMLLLSQSLFAQSGTTAAPKTKKQLNHEKMNALVGSKVSPSKKTRGGSRLIAMTHSNFNGTGFDLGDSTAYSYLSNYGYDPTSSEIYQDDFSPETIYNNYHDYFDASKTWDYGMGTPVLSDSTNCGFVSNHKRAFERTEYIPVPFLVIYHTDYDANENISAQIDTFISGGTPDYYKYVYSYNASNKIIAVDAPIWNSVSSIWEPDVRDSVFYDASNNISKIKVFQYNTGSSSWENSELYTYTWNAANKLTSEIDQVWNSGSSAWEDDYKVQNLWDGMNRWLSSTTSNYSSGMWLLNDKDSFAYGAGTFPTTYTFLQWDGAVWNNYTKNDYTYNASNQILSSHNFMWDDIGNVWNDAQITKYYYENYTPQGLTETNAVSGNMNVYPVPAGDVLTVTASWNETQSSVITITDMTGKVVHSLKCPVSKQVEQKIDMNSLKAGIYTITMKGEHGILTQRFTKK